MTTDEFLKEQERILAVGKELDSLVSSLAPRLQKRRLYDKIDDIRVDLLHYLDLKEK